MKKILTFLVMMLVTVSIVSAQNLDPIDIIENLPQAENTPGTINPGDATDQEPVATIAPRFNYQAVVRDRNNDDNLVMGETVNVMIEIINGAETIYTEWHSVETNRNGMVSFIIGEEEGVDRIGDLSDVDWAIAIIKATFTNTDDETLSVVENPVMPVPYALSANVDPLEITTKAICDYIAIAQASSVDSIFDAMLANESVKNQLKTRIVDYVKTQDELVRQLAIYFLGTVTPADVDAAYDTLTEPVKEKIKDLTVAYLKSDNGKAVVYDVLKYYLTNTSKTEVQELWAAARANENFHEIFNAVRDSVIDYIKAHKELVKNVAMYYMTVVDVQDVQDLHNYFKTQNSLVYNYMIGKLGDYLNSYLTNEYMAAKACVDDNNNVVDICTLQAELDELKQEAMNCPKILSASITKNNDNPNYYTFTATFENLTSDPGGKLQVTDSADGLVTPWSGSNTWNSTSKQYSFLYTQTPSGVYTFTFTPGGACNPSSTQAEYSGN